MIITNIYSAKTHLSQMIERALQGEEVIIAIANKPVVKLTAYHPNQKIRVPGSCKGKIKISPDFDTLPKKTADAFYKSSL